MKRPVCVMCQEEMKQHPTRQNLYWCKEHGTFHATSRGAMAFSPYEVIRPTTRQEEKILRLMEDHLQDPTLTKTAWRRLQEIEKLVKRIRFIKNGGKVEAAKGDGK